jgi:hypothetical protein
MNIHPPHFNLPQLYHNSISVDKYCSNGKPYYSCTRLQLQSARYQREECVFLALGHQKKCKCTRGSQCSWYFKAHRIEMEEKKRALSIL